MFLIEMFAALMEMRIGTKAGGTCGMQLCLILSSCYSGSGNVAWARLTVTAHCDPLVLLLASCLNLWCRCHEVNQLYTVVFSCLISVDRKHHNKP